MTSYFIASMVILSLISCGRAEFASDSTSGGAESTSAVSPKGTQEHEQLLSRARDAARLVKARDIDSSMTSAIVIDTVASEDPSGRITSLRSVMNFSLRNTETSPVTALEFEVPVNLDENSPIVLLERTTVDGREIPIQGTSSHWHVPVQLELGEATQIQFEMQAKLPEASRPKSELEAALKALPELAKRLPSISIIERHSFTGLSGDEAIMIGLWPRLVKAPRGLVTVLEVSLPSAAREPGAGLWEFAGTGTRGVSGAGGARKTTFVAFDRPEVALVAKRAPSRHLDSGEPWLEIWTGLPNPESEVMEGTRFEGTKEALELAEPRVEQVRKAAVQASILFERRWGGRAEPMTIVGLDLLNGRGMLQMPGLIALPSLHLDPSKLRAPAGNRLEVFAEKLLEHHPAPREALDYAVGFGLAAQRLSGRTDSSARWLEDGIGHLGGLALIESTYGDKARRRAIEFNLRLPYQLARLDGESDLILSRVPVFTSSTLAGLKSALFFEALERRLGAEVFDAVIKGLHDELSLPAFRVEVSARAAQHDKVDALLSRWCDVAAGDEDVGPFRPEVLLEYLLFDGATEGLKGLSVNELSEGGLAPKALGRVLDGEGIDASLALELLGDVLGDNASPATGRWLKIGAQLFDDKKREVGVGELVEEVGKELGLEPEHRARLETLSKLLLEAIADESANDDAPVPGGD